MAVKPWIGAIKEPDNHPPVNTSKPDTTYQIDYVYGYRCEDSRQNVFYNPDGNIVYMTACLGIILDKNSNTQTFFGGGEVENTSKQVAADNLHHNNDIMCLDVNTSGGRKYAVSGQVGKSPSIFVWDTQTAQKIKRFKLQQTARAVAACTISPDGKYIAVADKHNDHNVTVFNVDSGNMEWTDKGGPDEILDMSISRQDGNYHFWTAGKNHLCYWNAASMEKKKKGIYGEVAPSTSFPCVTTDDQGLAYAGAANSLIYVWQGNSLKQTIGVHN